MVHSHLQEPRPDDVAQVQKRALAIAKDFPAEGAPIPRKDTFVASVDAVAEAAYHLQWTEPEVAVGLHGLATVLNAARGFQATQDIMQCSTTESAPQPAPSFSADEAPLNLFQHQATGDTVYSSSDLHHGISPRQLQLESTAQPTPPRRSTRARRTVRPGPSPRWSSSPTPAPAAGAVGDRDSDFVDGPSTSSSAVNPYPSLPPFTATEDTQNGVFKPGSKPKEKPYVCGECGRGFTKRSDLRRHDKKHTGEKPFPCDVPGCGAAFIQPSALRVHNRIHTGEKPLKCEFPSCVESFADPSALGRHRRTHGTNNYSWVCTVAGCKRAFTRKDALLKHVARLHPEVSQQGTAASTTPDNPNSLTASHGNETPTTNSQTGAGAGPSPSRARRRRAPIHREIVSQLADQMAAATARWRAGGFDEREDDAEGEEVDGSDDNDSEQDDDYMEND